MLYLPQVEQRKTFLIAIPEENGLSGEFNNIVKEFWIFDTVFLWNEYKMSREIIRGCIYIYVYAYIYIHTYLYICNTEIHTYIQMDLDSILFIVMWCQRFMVIGYTWIWAWRDNSVHTIALQCFSLTGILRLCLYI